MSSTPIIHILYKELKELLPGKTEIWGPTTLVRNPHNAFITYDTLRIFIHDNTIIIQETESPESQYYILDINDPDSINKMLTIITTHQD